MNLKHICIFMRVVIESKSADFGGMFILDTFWHAPLHGISPINPWRTPGPSSPSPRPVYYIILLLFLVKVETCQGNLVQEPDQNA